MERKFDVKLIKNKLTNKNPFDFSILIFLFLREHTRLTIILFVKNV